MTAADSSPLSLPKASTSNADLQARREQAVVRGTLVQTCAENGLIILPCGMYGNVFRFLMPLTTPDDLIDEGMALLGKTLTSSVE